ncbi:MAG: ABC-2 family transporter protein [Anaerolineales bacterium]|nr:ABC-2 family transporter protein [Anaerolineales bacterium]
MPATDVALKRPALFTLVPWLEKYARAFELGFETELEYRANFALSLVSAAYPVFIQYFLWTAVYASSPGEVVYGFTYQQMMAYTFIAGLVSRIVRTGFEYEIMEDVKSGKYSKFLVQPLGYFPYRVASYFGAKLPNLGIILTLLSIVLLGLNVIWDVTVTLPRVLLFLAAIVLALGLNFLIFYGISAIAFWLTDIGFLFEGIRIVFILLSGGIFPLEVFGPAFLRVMAFLPFQYTVSYPIKVLNGSMAITQVYQGILVQLFWIALMYGLAYLLWRVSSKRYVAVGG